MQERRDLWPHSWLGEGMIKVMWFLKRAEGLSQAEFRAWWLDHMHLVADLQKPHLKRYTVNVRVEDDSLPAKPGDPFEWDGCAEQWFADEAGFRAAYERATPSASRTDTLKHTSRFSRMVVTEHHVPLDADVRVAE
jgi:EthD domain